MGGDSPFQEKKFLVWATGDPVYSGLVWDLQICCVLTNGIYTVFLSDCLTQEGEGQRSDYHLQPPRFPFI